MISHDLMCFLMDQKTEKIVEKEHFTKRGLAGLLNFINAEVPKDQKVYNAS
jgi:hypothetical protein